MPLSKEQQEAILASDSEQRNQRELLEDARLGINVTDTASDAYMIAHAPKDSHVNPCLVKGIGMVSPPVKPRASRNSWDRGMNCRTTVGTADPNVKTPTVRVTTTDGTSRIVAVSELRGINKRHTITKRVNKRTTPETARITLHGMDWSQ